MQQKSLSYKLNTSIIILLLLILIAGIYAIIIINKSQGYAQQTGTNFLPSVKSVSKISSDFGFATRRYTNIIGNFAINLDPEVLKTEIKEYKTFIDNLNKSIDEHKKLVDSADEQKILDNLIITWNENYAQMEKNLKIAESGNSQDSYKELLEKTAPLFFKTSNIISDLSKINTNETISSTKQGGYFTSLTNVTMSVIVVISVTIAVLILNIIRKSVNSINKAVDTLKEQNISTNQIASDLKTNSNSLSNAITEQSSSVHETSAAINEISSMVNRTAENARESSEVAKNASEKAEEGQVTMKKLVTAMETIQESNTELQNIAVIINQINTKTAVINDIVSKTELLSLNASIESARAGEYGKGFAMVAEEVGNLAKISGKSANEIQELITSSQEQVNTILGLTKERVDEGKKVTAEAQESFLKISEDISNMSSVILQISDATKEQEIGVRQISTAMANIDRATQNSHAAVTTASESANILVKESESLNSTTKDVELLMAGVNK